MGSREGRGVVAIIEGVFRRRRRGSPTGDSRVYTMLSSSSSRMMVMMM